MPSALALNMYEMFCLFAKFIPCDYSYFLVWLCFLSFFLAFDTRTAVRRCADTLSQGLPREAEALASSPLQGGQPVCLALRVLSDRSCTYSCAWKKPG